MALPLAVEAALAPDEIRRAPIGPGLLPGPRRQARWVGRVSGSSAHSHYQLGNWLVMLCRPQYLQLRCYLPCP